MTGTFSGLCVGGPWDGRIVSHDSPTLAVGVLDLSDDFTEPGVIPYLDQSSTKFFYTHVVALRGKFSKDFWIERGTTTEAAFAKVFDTYHLGPERDAAERARTEFLVASVIEGLKHQYIHPDLLPRIAARAVVAAMFGK